MHQDTCSIHEDKRRPIFGEFTSFIGVVQSLLILSQTLVSDCHIVVKVEVVSFAHFFCSFKLLYSLAVSMHAEKLFSFVGVGLKVLRVR